MASRKNIAFKGESLALAGIMVDENQEAPDFRLTGKSLEEKTLADFRGKIKVVTTFPSLDTPVCEMQVRKFNSEAAGFSGDVVVLGVSFDLPFAQSRFCETHGIRNVLVLSDHRYRSFALNYGLLIRQLGLMARAVLIIDQQDCIRYFSIVPELGDLPDYEKALERLGEITAGKTQGIPCDAARLDGDTWVPSGAVLTREITFGESSDMLDCLDAFTVLAREKEFHFVADSASRKVYLSVETKHAETLCPLLDRLRA